MILNNQNHVQHKPKPTQTTTSMSNRDATVEHAVSVDSETLDKINQWADKGASLKEIILSFGCAMTMIELLAPIQNYLVDKYMTVDLLKVEIRSLDFPDRDKLLSLGEPWIGICESMIVKDILRVVNATEGFELVTPLVFETSVNKEVARQMAIRATQEQPQAVTMDTRVEKQESVNHPTGMDELLVDLLTKKPSWPIQYRDITQRQELLAGIDDSNIGSKYSQYITDLKEKAGVFTMGNMTFNKNLIEIPEVLNLGIHAGINHLILYAMNPGVVNGSEDSNKYILDIISRVREEYAQLDLVQQLKLLKSINTLILNKVLHPVTAKIQNEFCGVIYQSK